MKFKNHQQWISCRSKAFDVPLNVFGLVLTMIVVGWTCYSVVAICTDMESDLCTNKYDLKRCSSWNDLANALTQITIGLSFFFIVLSPCSYHSGRNYGRAIFLLPVFLTFTVFAMYAMIHAGRVNSNLFLWWMMMTVIDSVLIAIGILNRTRSK